MTVPAAPSPERVKILVVDDHPENLLVLRETLASADCEVVEASSGGDALRKVLKQDFAVIVLDVLMPGMDGFETARLIRQRDASRDIPIIFLTATGADVSNIYQAYSVGAVDYLVKPLDPQILRAKVAVFVELFRKGLRIQQQEQAMRELERRRNAEALHESESLYQAAFDEAPVGIGHFLLPDSGWLRVNAKLCHILGRDQAEIMRSSFDRLPLGEEFQAKSRTAIQRILTGELGIYRGEGRLVVHGRTTWVHATVSLLRRPSGAPDHFIAVFQDATERKQTERRQRFLAAVGERLLSSLDYRATLAEIARLAAGDLADGCLVDVVSPDGRQLQALAAEHADPAKNDSLRELGAWLRKEPNHGTARVLRTHKPEFINGVTKPVIRTWAGGMPPPAALDELDLGSLLLVPITARDEVFGALALVWTSRAVDGKDELRVAKDVAHRAAFAVENARLYRKAQDAVRARDEFLSIASHELRTPLTTLQLALQRLTWPARGKPRQPPDAGAVLEACERSEKQVKRLARLVDNLLDVSRISAGLLDLQKEELDLSDVAREAVGRLCSDQTVELVVQEHITGPVDRLRLEQVLTNLVANAIKYGEGKPITVRVEQSGGVARFSVQDQGAGIEPDRLDKIFDRFERGETSRTHGGLGLGLYIAKQIMVAHGGTLTVTSAPGAGALFVAELPLTEAASAVQPPPATALKRRTRASA